MDPNYEGGGGDRDPEHYFFHARAILESGSASLADQKVGIKSAEKCVRLGKARKESTKAASCQKLINKYAV